MTLPTSSQQTASTPEIGVSVFSKDVTIALQSEYQILNTLPRFKEKVPSGLTIELDVVLGNDSKVYIVECIDGVPRAFRVGTKKADQIYHRLAKATTSLRSIDIKEINDRLIAWAHANGTCHPIYCRIGPSGNGIEIDCGHSCILVQPGHVEFNYKHSRNVFYTNAVALHLPVPANKGDVTLLKKYMNLTDMDQVLFLAWLSYTLGHPKISSTKFLILVINGDQGSGKSFISQNIILPLIDPSMVGIQVFPSTVSDFTIAANNAHLLCYDNMRNFKQSMADILCMASTGGVISSRTLYTNDEQHIQRLHVALVLNGIHQFINESDLAERCLTIRPKPITENQRRSESEMVMGLQQDLPIIFRGLLDLIAEIFQKLPEAKVLKPKRMIDFVYWLSAMELIDGVKPGTYQSGYDDIMNASQLDSLLGNLLASAIVDFVDSDAMQDGRWVGTPTELLEALELQIGPYAIKSSEWPNNPIALSKRLNSLKASLATQSIRIEFRRGRARLIRISNLTYGSAKQDHFEAI